MFFNAHWQHIPYEEDDQPIHTADNGYCCGDPDCPCAECGPDSDVQLALFLPSTEQTMRFFRASQGRSWRV